MFSCCVGSLHVGTPSSWSEAMGTLAEGTKANSSFVLMHSVHIRGGTICGTTAVCNSCNVGRHTCLAAGTAGKLRLDLFPFKANGILATDFRRSRMGT